MNISKGKEVLKMKQIKFIELEGSTRYIGGILTDSGDVICGCCGGLFESKDKGVTWDIVEEYDYWVNFSEKIIE